MQDREREREKGKWCIYIICIVHNVDILYPFFINKTYSEEEEEEEEKHPPHMYAKASDMKSEMERLNE